MHLVTCIVMCLSLASSLADPQPDMLSEVPRPLTQFGLSSARPNTGQLAPRVGVEPTSLILIQSQAGPADRPTGERHPRGQRQTGYPNFPQPSPRPGPG